LQPTGELQEFFKFKYYLVLTRVFEELIKDEIAHENSAQRKRQKQDSQKSGELIYIKPEDEILHKLSSWSFTFPVSADSLAAHQVCLLSCAYILSLWNDQFLLETTLTGLPGIWLPLLEVILCQKPIGHKVVRDSHDLGIIPARTA
jgi:hypothetical protein